MYRAARIATGRKQQKAEIKQLARLCKEIACKQQTPVTIKNMPFSGINRKEVAREETARIQMVRKEIATRKEMATIKSEQEGRMPAKRDGQRRDSQRTDCL